PEPTVGAWTYGCSFSFSIGVPSKTCFGRIDHSIGPPIVQSGFGGSNLTTIVFGSTIWTPSILSAVPALYALAPANGKKSDCGEPLPHGWAPTHMCQFQTTSSAVTGLPSLHFASGRSLTVIVLPVASIS